MGISNGKYYSQCTPITAGQIQCSSPSAGADVFMRKHSRNSPIEAGADTAAPRTLLRAATLTVAILGTLTGLVIAVRVRPRAGGCRPCQSKRPLVLYAPLHGSRGSLAVRV